MNLVRLEDLALIDGGAPSPQAGASLGAWGSAWVPGDPAGQSVLQKVESFLGALLKSREQSQIEAGGG